MKTRTLLFSIFSILFLLEGLSSCNGKKQDSSELIEIDSVVQEQEYVLAEKDTTKIILNSSIHYIFPKDARLLAVFNRKILGLDNADSLSADEAIKRYITLVLKDHDFTSTDSLFQDGDSFLGLYFQDKISNQILYQDKDIISCSSGHYTYEGGAHGYYLTDLFTLNKVTTKQITESDIFLPNTEEELAEIIQKELAKQYNVKDPSELEGIGFFDTKNIGPNNNFYLDEKGLHYCYNPYDIAAYAVGTVEVFIPYTLVESMLSPTAFVRQYLNK